MSALNASSVQKARTRLLLKQPWFGTLAIRLRLHEVTDDEFRALSGGMEPTMAVDGVNLFYSKTFFDKLPSDQQEGVMAHEVMHCALLHMTRRNSRNPILWNIAADYAINLILQENNFKLPEGALIDAKYKGMTAEQIYGLLQKNSKTIQLTFGGQKGKDFGHVLDTPKTGTGNKGDKEGTGEGEGGGQSSANEIEMDWKIAVEQANTNARKAGREPRGADRALRSIRESRTDWRDTARRYITTLGDYSWSRPNRRHVASGVFLPSMVKTRIKCVVFAVDTSGSIDERMLACFAGEVNGVIESTQQPPERIIVMYCDARVASVEEFEDYVTFRPKGGGGTAFQPVFTYCEKHDIEPAVLFYLTDLECSDRPEDPGYPVIWVTPDHTTLEAPFGEKVTIPINEYERR